MAKANSAYHKRDLYNEVTARILAELENHGPLLRASTIRTTQRLAVPTADAMSCCFGWQLNAMATQRHAI
jgi:hypothetical protein